MSDLPDPTIGSGISLLTGDNIIDVATANAVIPTPPINSSSSAAATAPPGINNSGTINLNPVLRTRDQIQTNVLNNYVDVIYNISLGLVSKATADQIAQGVAVTDSLTNYIVFASTGDTKTTANTANPKANYYNIQKLSFTSFVGHTPQNHLVAVTWDGKMTIFAPYGLQLRDDMIELAKQLGYNSTVSPLNYYFRLEIWFSGYSAETGEWTPRITVINPKPNNTQPQISVVYYLVITTMEANFNSTGTVYDLSFQTVNHETFRAETIGMHAGSHGVNVQGSVGTKFKDFLTNLANSMQAQILFDTNSKKSIKFIFGGLKDLLESKFAIDTNVDFTHGMSYNSGDNSWVVAGNNIDMLMVLEQALKNTVYYRDNVLQENDPTFAKPTIFWNIKSNILRADTPDTDANVYTQYTYQYIFEPVLTYRSRLPLDIQHRNPMVYPENQLARAQNMLAYGMLYRWYDYYFTANNSEIIDLQYKFKMFYYQPVSYPGILDPRGMDHNTADETVANTYLGQVSSAVAPFSVPTISSDLSSLFGDGTGVNQLVGPSVIIQGIDRNMTPTPGNYDAKGADQKVIRTLTATDNYFRFDMVNAEMTVRFDPTWLMNPYMVGGDSTPTVPSESTSDGAGGTVQVNAYTDRIVYINAIAPNQKSFMNPDLSLYTPQKPTLLPGMYTVIWAVNEFDGGKFIQKLHMIKNEWQNYMTPANIGSASQGQVTIGSDTTANKTLVG